jgi:3-dehydroquinate synthase
MRVMKLEGKSGTCQIVLGEGLENLLSHCSGNKVVVVTDSNVKRFYGERIVKAGVGADSIIEIGLGEGNKTLDTTCEVYRKLLELEIDRSCVIVGIGGGIVCDVSGFVASTYMRGIEFGFVPTTLLAQVDASIGGKNGVNLDGYKNIVGSIRQPKFCLCNFDVLKTLPREELKCGFAEVIKHAAIGNAELFAYLEANTERAMALHRTTIEKIVHDSIVVKVNIVKKDEFEKGERMKLNFGHTLGHAIERETGLSHGKAVAIGMVAAAKLSVAKGLLGEKDAERLEKLIEAYGLPTKTTDKGKLLEAMKKDKKRLGKKIRMALLEGIGSARIVEVGINELEGVLDG